MTETADLNSTEPRPYNVVKANYGFNNFLTLLRWLAAGVVAGICGLIVSLRPKSQLFIACVGVQFLAPCTECLYLRPVSPTRARPHAFWFFRLAFYTLAWAACSGSLLWVRYAFDDEYFSHDRRRSLEGRKLGGAFRGIKGPSTPEGMLKMYIVVAAACGLGALGVCLLQWVGFWFISTQKYNPEQIQLAFLY
ncbi:hypothetical protein ACJ41O_004953 [Fusarium nematophilum]